MSIFQQLTTTDQEMVVFCNDSATGLRAIIAVHDTTLGPSLGGLRMWPYASEGEALFDVIRLARGMTCKSAAAGLPLGGGKAVILGDSRTQKSHALLRRFGKFVNDLGGKYITAEDMGIRTRDIATISLETSHVAGLAEKSGTYSREQALCLTENIYHTVTDIFTACDTGHLLPHEAAIRLAEKRLRQAGSMCSLG